VNRKALGFYVEVVGEVMSAVSIRPARAAKKLIAAKTEMRMMIFTIRTSLRFFLDVSSNNPD
jgi:hypothetical protein